MTAADCYRILGLRVNASFEEVKTCYRRLARQYHPDVNPGDRHAQDKFIEITAAYKFLVAAQPAAPSPPPSPPPPSRPPKITVTPAAPPAAATPKPTPPHQPGGSRKAPPIQINPKLSPLEHQLKVTSYEQLQQFLKLGRFPRAVALVEGLAQRIPQDPEIAQWQAIAYQRWARQLICDRQCHKARIYLKKALNTDPHNRALWAEIEKDFQRLERLL
jgi:hypothetical protein